MTKIAAMCGAAMLVACAAGRSPAPRPFVIAQLREPAALDPLLIDGSVAENLGTLVFSYLVRVDAAGTLVPDVATEVPTRANRGIAADGRHLVYHLRRGVRWHDGEPLTARDVLFTYRAVMNPRNNVPTRLGYDQIAAIAAPDPYTVRITLKQPFAPFVTYFLEPENFPILPAHLLADRASLNDAPFNRAPIGSGPYRVVSWARGERLTLAANPSYWRGKPAIETIVVRFIADEQTILTGLRTGEIDASFDLAPANAEIVRAQLPAAAVATYPIYGFGALIFNTRAAGVSDPRVRRALVAALDRDAIVRKVSRGSLRAADAPRGLFGWAYVPAIQPPRYDPDAAAAQLEAAGITLDAHGVRWYRGRPLLLDLAFDGSSAIARTTAVVVQEQAARAGLTLRLRSYTPVAFHALDALGPLTSGRFALALDTVLTGYDPETSWFFRCDQAPPNGSNYARWCDRAADAVQNDALTTFDRARRARDYRVVQERVAADVPVAFLWETAGLAVTPRTLHGFAPSPETPFEGVAGWQLDPFD
ncbi:MAG TPA: peptide ABC transporter substrate-binding protein [Candidatus Elarobacter sp.]